MANFDIQKIIADSIKTIVSPKSYFSSMAKTGGFVEPMIKALVYGVVGGLISFLWIQLGLSFSFGGMGAGAMAASGVATLVQAIIGAIIGLFIGGVFMLILSLISGGSTDYEANVRVMASLMVMTPVSSLLMVTLGINLYLGGIIMTVVLFYYLWLLLNALIHALSAKPMVAKIVVGVLALLFIGGGFSMYRGMLALSSMGS